MYIQHLLLKGHLFRYRAPTRKEMSTIEALSNHNQYDFQERLLNLCMIEPKVCFDDETGTTDDCVNLARLPFLLGDVKILSNEILRCAGFYSQESMAEMVQQATAYIQSDPGKFDQLACMMLPGLSPDKLWNMDPSDVFKVWAMARNMAPVVGFDERMILDPEAWEFDQRKQSAEAKRQRMQAEAEAKANIGRRSNPKADQQVEAQKSFSVG